MAYTTPAFKPTFTKVRARTGDGSEPVEIV